jgi:hypothetical protein
VIGPQVTHVSCDLDQQKRRLEARKGSLGLAVRRSRGKRFLLDRLSFRGRSADAVMAEDLRRADSEDVLHGFRF